MTLADAVTRPAVSGRSYLPEPVPDVKWCGLSIVHFSRNRPQVFEAADRIRMHRLGKRPTSISPPRHPMRDAIAPIAGAMEAPTMETVQLPPERLGIYGRHRKSLY